MARTTITHIIDDLDGTKDAQEVTFSYNGTQFTIDLSKKNRAAFEKALAPYLEAATKVPARAGRRSARNAAAPRDLNAVREWARSQDIAVSDRGRVAQSVLDQYDAAH